MTATPLERWQLRIVAVGWATYAGFYLGRVNLSSALPDLRSDLGWSAQTAGTVATGFFLAYAAGQLVAGQLGDRRSPRRLVLFGMVASALLNLAFGALNDFVPLLIVWSANGFFQAFGWAPMLKLLANWHTPAGRRRVAGVFATSFVVGNALTWVLAGWLTANYGWRWALWLPGAAMLLLALLWALLMRDRPEEVGLSVPEDRPDAGTGGHQGVTGAGLVPAFRRVWPLTLAALGGGFVLFALVVWTPSLLVDTLGLGLGAASSLATLLPVAGVVGTLLTGWLATTRMAGREARLAALLLAALAALALLFPTAASSTFASAALLALIGAAAYGASSLLLSTLPLLLSARHETAGVAAVVDFAFNLGASLGGAAVGLLVDRLGWGAVFVALALSALLAATALLLGVERRTGRAP
jgi:sugar phosphate permease